MKIQESIATATTKGAAVETGRTIDIEMDRIILIRPVIELQGHEFINPRDSRTQLTRWTPERAVISHGMVIIDEYGALIPVSAVRVIRYDAVIPATSKVS